MPGVKAGTCRIRVNPRKSAAKKRSKNKCGPGQPPEPHRFVDLSTHLPAARSGETMALVRQRSQGVPHLPVRTAEARFRESLLCNPCGSQLPSPLKSRLWRRPQCPGNRHALARVSEFPLAIHPRELPVCHRRHRNHPLASIENCHVFAEPTLSPNVAAGNRKTFPPCAEPVDDETSLWKAEEKCGGNRETKIKPFP
jgi:hypothetical protein